MNRIEQCFALEELEDAAIAAENTPAPCLRYTLEDEMKQICAAKVVVNGGGKWDESTSRIHCCEIFYRNPRYIQESVKVWGMSIKEAYDKAWEAFAIEKAAGRAL